MVVIPCELDGQRGISNRPPRRPIFVDPGVPVNWLRRIQRQDYTVPKELSEFAALEAGRSVEGRRPRAFGDGFAWRASGTPWPFVLWLFGRRRMPDDTRNAEAPLLVDDVITES
jgi:hypothetical protein